MVAPLSNSPLHSALDILEENCKSIVRNCLFLLLILKTSLKDEASEASNLMSVMESAECFILKDIDRDLVPEYEKRKYGLIELTNVSLSDLITAISLQRTRVDVSSLFITFITSFYYYLLVHAAIYFSFNHPFIFQ